MPSRNIIRLDGNDRYYHVYARGASKSIIFRSDQDKDYFLLLLARYLSVKPARNNLDGTYPHFRGKIELLSFCLMDNHFHMLIFQHRIGTLANFMKCVMASYSMYFNFKYGKRGPLFESRYKSVVIESDTYLLHVSRYIHLNPRNWKMFRYSSLRFIRDNSEPEWLQTEKVLELHKNREVYLEFVADYEDNKNILKDIKHNLANR